MAGTIIDMSKIKQLLHLKKAGVSNRQIAKDLKMSRDKANEYVNRAESDPLGIDGLLKLDDMGNHYGFVTIPCQPVKPTQKARVENQVQIINDRYHRKSLILSSQLAVADWYGVFSNKMLAEACLDRIVHKSLRF